MTARTDSTSDARDVPGKAVLFCPSCGHVSPVTGDWERRASGTHVVYACPECGAPVTTQPARARPHE